MRDRSNPRSGSPWWARTGWPDSRSVKDRPNPRGPRLEPEAVIKAALKILDEEGLEKVTLRRIAVQLGVQAPTLYWYFKDKSVIMDDMAQAILKEGGIDELKPPVDREAWAEWLSQTAHSLRRAMVSHREGGRVVAGASFRSQTMQKLKMTTTQVLYDAGFDLLHAALGSETITDYVWGFVIEEQTNPTDPFDPAVTISARTGAENDRGQELMERVMDEWTKRSPEELFDWGLQLIISGLKQALADQRAPSKK